ncbi:TetR/AcrR family transcriptional regulator [Pseudoruegeria sp. HB172150]|uniref:TetR/AcrR family transcriptional regulator n=1 Tax=Pseudoruegeria sp. HB172150 TaxID=2721164 RepID=UPI001552B4FB|nr:TetR/AcrR family transcriptional regulator [Pseudoruegeria sp. HB172150]
MSDERPKRGRPRSRASRDAILGTVRRRLLADGYQRLTMEAVAEEAGVSKATIYRWWTTKGELVLEAAEAEISIGPVPETGDPRSDVEATIDQVIDTFSRPLASIVIFAAITTGGDDPVMARSFRDRYVHPWRASGAAALGRALPDGGESGVQFLLDVIFGTVFQRLLVLREPNTHGLTERLLAVVLPAVDASH